VRVKVCHHFFGPGYFGFPSHPVRTVMYDVFWAMLLITPCWSVSLLDPNVLLFFWFFLAPGTAHRRLVQSAVEGNFNMLRVWGQGIWEPRAFHDACDEMGVLLLTDSQIEPMYVRVCNTFFYFDGRPICSRTHRSSPCFVSTPILNVNSCNRFSFIWTRFLLGPLSHPARTVMPRLSWEMPLSVSC